MFKVDTLLYLFAFIVKQLLKTADRSEEVAQGYQEQIDRLSASKNDAVKESKRARKIADNIENLLK